MSNAIKALREQKQHLAREANNLLSNNGDRVWTKEDQTKFDDIADQMSRIDAQIDAHQKLIDDAGDKSFNDVERHRKPQDQAQLSDAQRAMNVYLRKQTKDMSNEEIELIRNTMSTTTGSEGGNTVATEVASTLINALRDYGAMRRNATRYVTSNGAAMNFPNTDGTTEEGEILGENAPATTSDPTFGTVPINTFKFGSKIITAPIELLQDSSIDVESMIFGRVKDRIGRIQNRMFTTGTGSGQPFGASVAATVGKTGTTGQTTTVIYDDLVDLVDSLDVAYMIDGVELKFMTSQTMRRVIRKIKDTAGRPIWTPSYDQGISGGMADNLLGYKLEINNNMPTPAANAKSILFGDITKYFIRDAMDIKIFKFEDSPFTSKGQIGFLAWARAGGNLTDTSALKAYQHSAT